MWWWWSTPSLSSSTQQAYVWLSVFHTFWAELGRIGARMAQFATHDTSADAAWFRTTATHRNSRCARDVTTYTSVLTIGTDRHYLKKCLWLVMMIVCETFFCFNWEGVILSTKEWKIGFENDWFGYTILLVVWTANVEIWVLVYIVIIRIIKCSISCEKRVRRETT